MQEEIKAIPPKIDQWIYSNDPEIDDLQYVWENWCEPILIPTEELKSIGNKKPLK